MAKKLNSRALAAQISWKIIDKGLSLDATLRESVQLANLDSKDKGLVQELSYGVCRWYGDLDAVAASLLAKPIRNKDRIVHFILLVGLYQLRHMRTPDHAAVDESVKACKQLNKVWAKNLINGCLREYARSENANLALDGGISQDIHLRSLPTWISTAFIELWGKSSNEIIAASNQRPPMCLRVNQRQSNRKQYLELLNESNVPAHADRFSQDGIILDRPVNVGFLPGFDDGAVSVQDTAAQLACDILQVEKNHRVLDACAAPGGKTAHILERTDNQISMHAMDVSASRCEQLTQTLQRLQLTAQISIGDASQDLKLCRPLQNADNATASNSFSSTGYDRILIDAPCSGTGVIRRHPDIKHHRRQSDIEQLLPIQQGLLVNLWSNLAPNGLLLYMTCSILAKENNLQIAQFLKAQPDAQAEDFYHPNALDLDFGKQTLPGVHEMDGFYYCLLRKPAS